jgi:hypothetical protein
MGEGGGRRVGCWEGLGLGEWMDGYLLDIECILAVYFSSNGLGKMLF